MDTNTRLRLATRIHFGLLRHLGDSVEVQDILHRPADSREVLWVCDASGDDELIALAAQFRQASRPVEAERQPPAKAPATPIKTASRRRPMPVTPQDTSWGRDTSGFGISQPPDFQPSRPHDPSQAAERKGERERDWFRPSTWLRTR